MVKLTKKQELLVIASSHFSEWDNCESDWDFAPVTIYQDVFDKSIVEVLIRSHKADTNGLKLIAFATFKPKNKNFYKFNCRQGYLVDKKGNIVGNQKIEPFEDKFLAEAVYKHLTKQEK